MIIFMEQVVEQAIELVPPVPKLFHPKVQKTGGFGGESNKWNSFIIYR